MPERKDDAPTELARTKAFREQLKHLTEAQLIRLSIGLGTDTQEQRAQWHLIADELGSRYRAYLSRPEADDASVPAELMPPPSALHPADPPASHFR